MEAVLAAHPAVAECAVIGVSDDLKGQLPHGFVVLKSGVDTDLESLRAELIQAVRDQVGAVAAFKKVDVVPALPKTRSGKILRKTMRGIAEGADEPAPRPSRTRRCWTSCARSSDRTGSRRRPRHRIRHPAATGRPVRTTLPGTGTRTNLPRVRAQASRGDHVGGVCLRGTRMAAFLALLPQVFMEHHRRLPPRLVSR
ncbi:hypothetical protein ACFQX6_29715 [Streptosporangium lutulentum]